MHWAIIGLPNSGRSTLFRLLTHKGSSARSGKGINLAVVKVPDWRFAALAEVFNPDKITRAEIEFVDSTGRIGKGGATFSELQRADCLVFCVRAFDGGFGQPNPLGDLQELTAELTLFDLGAIERKIEACEKGLRTAKPDEKNRLEKQLKWFSEFKIHLEAGGVLRDLELNNEQREIIANFALITAKPVFVVLNCDEEHYANRVEIIGEARKRIPNMEILPVMTQLEIELEELEESEAEVFRVELGITDSPVEDVIRAAYDTMGIKTFFTGGDNEVRAWTVPSNFTASECAGRIHSDMERGFIRAEVVSYDELIELGTWAEARNKGKLRQEGKEYFVKDGDVILMKFAV